MSLSRRRFLLNSAAAAAAGAWTYRTAGPTWGQDAGDRPEQAAELEILNPAGRVPVSLIIDDSTCLVNLAHFAIPQFAEVFPDRYLQDWKSLPREIPDAFVRKFGEWCGERGIKGKYSIVPYPACVGWVDRDLPGWSRKELTESVDLVRSLLLPNWDIHPEMVSHTWVIDTKTGRPYPERSIKFMENWDWSVGKSADELADYLAFALKILKNAGLPCEGVTTPGGFGNRSLEALSQATLESCQDVFGAEIPHYFRHLYTDSTSVAPRVEYAKDLASERPKCVVSIIGCTGDWFGGWDGLEIGTVDQFITEDLQRGRLPEVIERGEPAILVCHWPGIYCNGDETGFRIFQDVVERLNARYDHLIWLKLSEIARYWAARELTAVSRTASGFEFRAPFATPRFTTRFQARKSAAGGAPRLAVDGKSTPLREIANPKKLESGTWIQEGDRISACFDLPRGKSRIEVL